MLPVVCRSTNFDAMKAKGKYEYLEWFSPDEMHEESLRWFSELHFARDEQFFLNKLVKSHTLQLADADRFEESKLVVDALLKKENEGVVLMKKVQVHENQLGIMVDGVDQLRMEKAYIETHKELLVAMNEYMATYRKLKKTLFALISKVLKRDKQKRLLN